MHDEMQAFGSISAPYDAQGPADDDDTQDQWAHAAAGNLPPALPVGIPPIAEEEPSSEEEDRSSGDESAPRVRVSMLFQPPFYPLMGILVCSMENLLGGDGRILLGASVRSRREGNRRMFGGRTTR